MSSNSKHNPLVLSQVTFFFLNTNLIDFFFFFISVGFWKAFCFEKNFYLISSPFFDKIVLNTMAYMIPQFDFQICPASSFSQFQKPFLSEDVEQQNPSIPNFILQF